MSILTSHCLEICCRHSSKQFILSASRHFAKLLPLEGSLESERYFPMSNLFKQQNESSTVINILCDKNVCLILNIV